MNRQLTPADRRGSFLTLLEREGELSRAEEAQADADRARDTMAAARTVAWILGALAIFPAVAVVWWVL